MFTGLFTHGTKLFANDGFDAHGLFKDLCFMHDAVVIKIMKRITKLSGFIGDYNIYNLQISTSEACLQKFVLSLL